MAEGKESGLPSLKRLQNLEKDHSKVQDQISELGSIVEIHGHRISSSRGQWALKWLLEKLQAKDDNGQQVRSTPEAWQLLLLLVDSLTAVSVASALQQHGFQTTVAAALQECSVGLSTNSSAPSMEKSNGLKRKATEGLESSGKKRKAADAAAVVVSNVPNNCTRTLQCVVRVLQKLRARPSHGQHPGHLPSRDYLQSVLRADHDTARESLNAGLRAIARMFMCDENPESLEIPNIHECLTAVLHTWETRRSPPAIVRALHEDDNARTQSLLFSSVAIANEKLQGDDLEGAARSHLIEFVRTADRFTAKHLIMPLKTAFQSLDHEEQVELSRVSAAQQWNLSPIKPWTQDESDIWRLLGGNTMTTTQLEDLFSRSTAALLKCVLKCSSLNSPQKRVADTPWINFIFSRAFAPFEPPPHVSEPHPERTLTTVGRMLDVGVYYNISLDDDILCKQLLQKVGLGKSQDTATEAHKVDWRIVDQIVTVFRQFVVPIKGSGTTLERQPQIFDTIMAHAGSELWLDTQQSSANPSQLDQLPDYDFVKSHVLPSLIQAFKTGRSHIEFLSTWHEKLSSIHNKRTRSTTNSHSRLNLLEDPEMALEIAKKLIPTMHLDQKTVAINSLTTDEPAGPALTVLWPLLRSLSATELNESSLAAIWSVVERCSSLLATNASSQQKCIYWRVLATAINKWISAASTDSLNRALSQHSTPNSIHEILVQILESWHFSQIIETEPVLQLEEHIRLAMGPLTCLGVLVTSCGRRHFALERSVELNVQLHHIVSQIKADLDSNMDRHTRAVMQSSLRTFPRLGARIGEVSNSSATRNQQTLQVSVAIPLHSVDNGQVNLQRGVLAGKTSFGPDIMEDENRRTNHERFLAMAKALNQFSREARVKVLFQELPAEMDAANVSTLTSLALIVQARKDWPAHTDLSPIILALSHTMSLENSYTTFSTCTKSLLHLLQSKKIHLTQHALESIVLAVTRILGPGESQIHTKHSRNVFRRLCHILQTLCARNIFRRRLRDRMHLLLQPLQGLLRCLFVSSSRSPSLRILQPQWVSRKAKSPTKEEIQEPDNGLNAQNAVHLTRLLTLLADPPLSALSSASASRNKPALDGASAPTSAAEPLIDPTARARAYMAHFAPLLLGEYANCMLRGRFCANGVREALQPGIWALLDIMERNGIGIDALGVITGKAEGAREVLRALVGKWRKGR